MRGNKTDKILFLIIIFAFLLGLGNPFMNSPLAYTVGDEFESQRVALQILNSRSFIQSSYYLPLWAWIQMPFIVLVIIFLKIFNFFPNFEAIKEFVIFNPGFFLPIGRILSAFFSSLSLVWVYKIGEKIQSKTLGLLAALFWGGSFMRIHLAHFGRVNSLFLFLSLGFLYFVIKLIKNKNIKDTYLSIVFLTLAIAIYPFGVTLLPVFILGLLLTKRHKAFLKKKVFVFFIVLNFLFFIFLVKITPGMLENYLEQIEISSQNLTLFNKLFFYGKVLITYELPFVILGFLGIKKLFKLRKDMVLTIVSFSIFSTIPYFAKYTAEPRYLMLFYFPFILSSALFTEKFIQKKHILKKLFFIGLVLGYPLLLALRLTWLVFQKSTYLQTKEWVEKNIAPQVPILLLEDNLGLAPDLLISEPIILYKPSYHLSQRLIFQKKPYALTRNVRFLNDLLVYLPENDLKKHLEKTNYEFFIINYKDEKEKEEILNSLPFARPSLIEAFYPAELGFKLTTLLNLENPLLTLFSTERAGPYFEVYKIH